MTAAAEASVAAMVGKVYSGEHEAPLSAPELTVESDKYEFDADFQTKVATHVMRDQEFMRKVGHLIRPEYFENAGEAAMVNLASRFFNKYGSVPSMTVAKDLLKEDVTTKVIRSDSKAIAVEAFRAIFGPAADLGNGNYVAERVAEFARHQAMSQATSATNLRP